MKKMPQPVGEKEDRDPKKINPHLKIKVQDILGEPDSIHSIDFCWSFSGLCFQCFRDLVYNILTCLFGLCIAGAWGLGFGVIAFEHIWFITPITKVIKLICVDTFQKCWKLTANLCITPWTKACARCLGVWAPPGFDWDYEELPPAKVRPIKIKQKKETLKPKKKEVKVSPQEPDMYLGEKEKIKRSVQRQLLL